MDMPANFVPEAMAPIIRFMYTGNNAFLCFCFFNILKISRCNTLKTFAIRWKYLQYIENICNTLKTSAID